MSNMKEDDDITQIGIKIPDALYRKLKFYCFIHRITYADLIRAFLEKKVGNVEVPTRKAA